MTTSAGSARCSPSTRQPPATGRANYSAGGLLRPDCSTTSMPATTSRGRDWRLSRRHVNFSDVMSSAAHAVTRWIVPFLTVAAVTCFGVSAGTTQVAPTPQVRLTADGANPLDGQNFYVNPNSKAMRAANGASSPQLTAIANTPTAYWMDNLSTPSVDAKY